MSRNNRIMLFAGGANRHLSESVAGYLNTELCQVELTRFSDGEISVMLGESVRGQDVFVMQALAKPVNDHLMELLIMLDALKRSSAGSITAVLPYYAYARQDRQEAPRRPITAKLVADLVTAAGADRVMSMDLHAGQIQGFFSIPFEHLQAIPVLEAELRKLSPDPANDLVIVSPDAGGVERARRYSKRLGSPLAIIDKRRSKPNVAEIVHIIGDVRGKVAVLVDDMIDTAGTITGAAAALLDQGAREVHAFVTHPVLSGAALERVSQSALTSLVVCDTIPLSDEAKACQKIRLCSVASVLGEAIQRVHGEMSVSSLFG
jgi:ribose-phosphate pyrophosphokinase